MKNTLLIIIVLISLCSCSSQQKRERLVVFKFFNGENEKWNYDSLVKNVKLLNEDNKDITFDKELGIRKNDTTDYLSFKGLGGKMIRKFVFKKDTMLLYFKPRYQSDDTLDLTYRIDKMEFLKGKHLINMYHHDATYNGHFEVYGWQNYYMEYSDLVLKEKQENPNDYKKTQVFKEFSKLRKLLYRSEYDFRPPYCLFKFENLSLIEEKFLVHSIPIELNNRKYFWEFTYKQPKEYRKGFVKLIDQHLIDVEKEEIVLVVKRLQSDSYDIKDLKAFNMRGLKFVDINFDGKKDFFQDLYAKQAVYMYNDSTKMFKYFEKFGHSRLEIDSINKRLINKETYGHFEKHRVRNYAISFKKDGSIDFIEQTKKEAIKINNRVYRIIKKSKEIIDKNEMFGSRFTEEKPDTIEIKPDHYLYKRYQERLKENKK